MLRDQILLDSPDDIQVDIYRIEIQQRHTEFVRGGYPLPEAVLQKLYRPAPGALAGLRDWIVMRLLPLPIQLDFVRLFTDIKFD
jgi:hypothetical protein